MKGRRRAWLGRGLLAVALLVPMMLWLSGCWLFNVDPVASFTVSTQAGDAPLAVNFSAILSSDEDGTIVSQLDRIPANWLRPTSGWRPGEYVVDEYRLPMPPDLAPGAYHLYTGLFDPETMARQPLIVDGEIFPEARFQLPSILVEP